LWENRHWFSASTFVVKIATFAKPETVWRNKSFSASCAGFVGMQALVLILVFVLIFLHFRNAEILKKQIR
jgi:hypothetical protein